MTPLTCTTSKLVDLSLFQAINDRLTLISLRLLDLYPLKGQLIFHFHNVFLDRAPSVALRLEYAEIKYEICTEKWKIEKCRCRIKSYLFPLECNVLIGVVSNIKTLWCGWLV